MEEVVYIAVHGMLSDSNLPLGLLFSPVAVSVARAPTALLWSVSGHLTCLLTPFILHLTLPPYHLPGSGNRGLSKYFTLFPRQHGILIRSRILTFPEFLLCYIVFSEKLQR